MEVCLNFDKKELVIKEAANVKELYKRLEKLLGKDISDWTMVSDVVYQNSDWWYYKPYRHYPWPTHEVTCHSSGSLSSTTTSGVYCLSDTVLAVSEEGSDGTLG